MHKRLFLWLCFFAMSFAMAQNTEIYPSAGGTLMPEVSYYCDGQSFQVKANATASTTGDYEITRQSATAYDLSAGSNLIKFDETASSNNNKFSERIEIGFPFSFYGKTYRYVSVGINGRLVFNDDKTGELHDKTRYTDRTFTSDRTPIPSPKYNRVETANPNAEINLGQIFFGFTDLNTNSTAGTRRTYRRLNNGLLISFQNIILGNYNSGGDASVLLLNDGRIIIYSNRRTRLDHNAILGIQNETVTKAKVPRHKISGQDYNNGTWQSEADAFVFTPSKKLTPKIEWYKNDTFISNSDEINITPTETQEEWKVKILFFDEDGNLVSSKESKITFKKIEKPTINAVTGIGCASGTTLSVGNPIDELQYEWLDADDTSFREVGTSIITPKSGNYYVKVNNCVESDRQIVNQVFDITPPTFSDNHEFKICDALGYKIKTINLLNMVNYPTSSSYTIEFLDEKDVIIANAGKGYNINLTSGETKKLKLRVRSKTTTCETIRAFSVKYLSLPENDKTFMPRKLCFGTVQYTIKDFIEFLSISDGIIVKFSTDNVNFNLESVNPSVHQSIKVKLTHPEFNCESIVTVNFQFHPKIEIKPTTPFPAHCYSSTEYFDLEITKRELEYSPEIVAHFYNNNQEIKNLHFRGSGTIYVKLENTSTGCWVDAPTITLEIYRPPTLVKPSPETKKSVCGSQFFDLTTDINDYIKNWTRYSEIRYFRQNGTQLSQSEWKNYNPNASGQPYMVFVYNETNNLECSDRIEFNLIESKKPTAKTNSIIVCSETSISLEAFKNQLISEPSKYSFFESNGTTELRSDIVWSTLPHTVQFYIKDNESGCLSDLQNIHIVNGLPTKINTNEETLTVCDSDFDGFTSFDLDSAKKQFTTDSSASFEYYKDEDLSQSISSNYTNETAFNQTIYVKITIAEHCPTIAKINLKVNTPSESSTLKTKYFICYGETVPIDAGSENTQWQWSDGQTTQIAQFRTGGSYSVTLTNNDGCSHTHYFEISTENQPIIDEISNDNSTITVITKGGIAPYQYSFDGGNTWQSSNIYPNPSQENYTIFVKSANGCLGEPKSIYNIKIYNVITPNGDGKNDTWKIENIDKMEQLQISIVDRYGKVVFHSEDKNKTEWDGKLNGKPIPTGTYWYVVKWFDASRNRNEMRQGWIMLQNRD